MIFVWLLLLLLEGGCLNFNYTVSSEDFEFINLDLSSKQSWKLNDSQIVGPVDLPFDFVFWGNVYNSIYINSNGIISFVPNINPTIQQLQCNSSINSSILHYFQDLTPNGTDPLYMSSFTACPVYSNDSACVILQFQNYHTNAGAISIIAGTWEVVLSERGDISLLYLDTGQNSAITALIGISLNTTQYITVHCTTPLSDSTAILLSPTFPEKVALEVQCVDTLSGGQLVLTGKNFGSQIQHIAVSLGSEYCNVLSVNNTVLVCIVSEEGTGANQPITVFYKNTPYVTSFNFSYPRMGL
jgi:hypothetical protein